MLKGRTQLTIIRIDFFSQKLKILKLEGSFLDNNSRHEGPLSVSWTPFSLNHSPIKIQIAGLKATKKFEGNERIKSTQFLGTKRKEE